MNKIFYFTASWCLPCRSFRPVLNEAISQTGANIQIIDVDQQPEVAQKFGVTSVPTLIVTDPSGNPIKRNSGTMSKPQLLNFLN